MLVTIVSLLIALSIMIFVHELGHLIAAKTSHVVVEEFGLGYPPRLVKLWRGKGQIVVDGKTITIPRRLDLPEAIGPGMVVRTETSIDAKGRTVLAHIEAVSADSTDPEAGRKVEFLDRGTLYSINAIPFGGFTKMRGEEDPAAPGSLASKKKRTRIWVLMAGALMNMLTAVLFFALAYGLGAPTYAQPENAVVVSVTAGSPAEGAGLQPGDVIVRADATAVDTVLTLQEYTQAHLGAPITLTIERNGAALSIAVVPRTNPPANEGPMGITLSPRIIVKKYVWYEAAWQGLKESVTLAGFTLTVPIRLIRGLIPANLARPVGPVGIGELVGDAVQYSLNTGRWFPVMQMLGSLSVALAVTNLLPLPALDGGRILFVVVEAIRGRRVDPAKEAVVHLIGMALLLALMLVITWQDIVNPLPKLDWSQLFR